MSKTTFSESTFYGSREPQWLVESPQQTQSHFDRRGCVRQIRTSGYRSNTNDLHMPGRNEGLPKRTSYVPLEQPSTVNANRQAYVYSSIPATHRTVTAPQPGTFNTDFVSNIPIVEFMVPLCCGKCEEKVKEELENVEGVYMVVCDQHNQRVTVSSTLDPQRLLKRVKRVKKNSHFWRCTGSSSNYSRNIHHDVPSFQLPSDGHSNHSLVVHRSHIPAAYVKPDNSYLKSKSLKPESEDPELHVYYAAGADHQLHKHSIHHHGSVSPFTRASSQGSYTTGTPYNSNVSMDHASLIHYSHYPCNSYGRAYEYESGDYALSSTAYY